MSLIRASAVLICMLISLVSGAQSGGRFADNAAGHLSVKMEEGRQMLYIPIQLMEREMLLLPLHKNEATAAHSRASEVIRFRKVDGRGIYLESLHFKIRSEDRSANGMHRNVVLSNLPSLLYIFALDSTSNSAFAKVDVSRYITRINCVLDSNSAIQTQLVLLPAKPIIPYSDALGIGMEQQDFISFDHQRSARKQTMLNRFRLEPSHSPDEGGGSVEAAEPIVFQLDGSISAIWKPNFKKGIEAWQPVFEKAGFRKAIFVQELPIIQSSKDPSLYRKVTISVNSLAEAAVVDRYTDPRTGEIIHVKINCALKALNQLKDSYLVQTGQLGAAATEEMKQAQDNLIQQEITALVGQALGLKANHANPAQAIGLAYRWFPSDSNGNSKRTQWLSDELKKQPLGGGKKNGCKLTDDLMTDLLKSAAAIRLHRRQEPSDTITIASWTKLLNAVYRQYMDEAVTVLRMGTPKILTDLSMNSKVLYVTERERKKSITFLEKHLFTATDIVDLIEQKLVQESVLKQLLSAETYTHLQQTNLNLPMRKQYCFDDLLDDLERIILKGSQSSRQLFREALSELQKQKGGHLHEMRAIATGHLLDLKANI